MTGKQLATIGFKGRHNEKYSGELFEVIGGNN